MNRAQKRAQEKAQKQSDATRSNNETTCFRKAMVESEGKISHDLIVFQVLYILQFQQTVRTRTLHSSFHSRP